MIIVSHDFIDVKSVTVDGNLVFLDSNFSIGETIYVLAKQYDDKIIIWCHEKVKDSLDLSYITKSLVHDRLLFSYTPFKNFLPNDIGYVEDSPFINVNKKVQYPTWQMSSYVGAVRSKTILLTDSKLWFGKNFDLGLTSIAKTYQPLGLFCYSDPKLIQKNVLVKEQNASYKQLFYFVKQQYKTTWIYLLLLNLVIYEKKFPLIPFFNALLFSKRVIESSSIAFKDLECEINFSEETIDVIIPTIGRKKYLYDVLCDLKNQSHLPQNVIIVEQNPLADSASELDYLTNEEWPFCIKHIFTHQTGACQARNRALNEVKSKWLFLNDDDNRFDSTLLEEAIYNLVSLKINCLQTAYPQLNEKINSKIISQTTIFGSGNAFLKAELVAKVKFNLALEFGYGEDTEFGLQLRNIGVDVIYFPNLKIAHLKAPIGGFRTKFVHPWELEKIQPKPSPTVLFYRLKYYTKEQVKGYKTILFLKFYKSQEIKSPFSYFRMMQQKWITSVKWANKLLKKNEV